jgi:rhomboid protease GluP
VYDGEREPPEEPRERPIRITADMLDESAPADTRIDFEADMTYAPRVTLALIVMLAVVFLWQIDIGALQSRESIIQSGALARERVVQGEYWRLLSATALHGGFEHLVSNVISLYILGMAAEHAFGSRSMLVMYVVSGIAGSLLSMATGPGPSVGASGAIFGLMGAVIVLFWRYHDELLVRDKRIGIVIAVWAAYTIVVGMMTPMIDNAGHIGGLLGGMLAAWSVRPRILRSHVRRAA